LVEFEKLENEYIDVHKKL